ncbi:hypothetical protein [Micromonospora psammae]|uniref:hypothetical protein n=1 Tax=Micromonospora sp. CPCC 205556 TaxID=3122398 RepID=UPI002FF0FAA5
MKSRGSGNYAGVATTTGRGLLAGVAGTVVMTAFQKLIDMPLTEREDSYAPADFAERVLPIHPRTTRGRTGLNYATHFGRVEDPGGSGVA